MRDAARFAAVTGLAMVASLLCALLIKDLAGLHGDLSVLAVAVAVSTGRILRARDPASRVVSVALLPVIAVVGSLVGGRMLHQPVLGDTLFTLGITAGIWLRRFGRRAASAGAVLSVPFVALLVVPAPVRGGAGHDLWSAVIAAQAGLWSLASLTLAERTGVLAPVPQAAATLRTRARARTHADAGRTHADAGRTHADAGTTSSADAERSSAEAERSSADAERSSAHPETHAEGGETHRQDGFLPPRGVRAPAGARLRAVVAAPRPASSRMALQMGLGLGAAFLLGHALWPTHWTWIVISAFVVASGNRGRADVLYKCGLRILGAAAGTVLATLLIQALPAGDDLAIVLIMIVLAVGTWLRQIGYAYWAAAVTGVVALLNGYYGERSSALLGTRLVEIVCGGLIAAVIALTVMPVKTTDVMRRRVADALAALTDHLTAARRRDLAARAAEHARVRAALAGLEEIAPPLRLARRFSSHREHHPASALQALEACGVWLDRITTRVRETPELLASDDFATALKEFQEAVVKARRAMAASEPPLPVARIVELAERIERLAGFLSPSPEFPPEAAATAVPAENLN